jgi:hypothetical protein
MRERDSLRIATSWQLLIDEADDDTRRLIVAYAAMTILVKTDKPAIVQVEPLVRAYLSLPENTVGGNLHIMLDDGNTKAKDVDFCIARAEADEDWPGYWLARVLARCSRTQRKKLSILPWQGPQSDS